MNLGAAKGAGARGRDLHLGSALCAAGGQRATGPTQKGAMGRSCGGSQGDFPSLKQVIYDILCKPGDWRDIYVRPCKTPT